MMKLLVLIGLITFTVCAQVQGTKVSYPTGIRLLKQIQACTQPNWRKYDSGLEYVEVKSFAKHCQQFNDYIIPTKPDQGPGANMGKWGNGKTSQQPTPSNIFLGTHYEVVSETEVFVQILSNGARPTDLEDEVILQCKEWLESLGKIEPSNKLPQDCK